MGQRAGLGGGQLAGCKPGVLRAVGSQGSCYREMPANLCPHPAARCFCVSLPGGPLMTLAFVRTVGYMTKALLARRPHPLPAAGLGSSPSPLCKRETTLPAPSQGTRKTSQEHHMENGSCEGAGPWGVLVLGRVVGGGRR